MNFAKKLKKSMEIKGFSNSRLAKEIGTNESTISRYISGNMIPKIDVLKNICEVLEVSADWLIS